MSKSMMNFTKGVITGVVVGTTVSMCMKSMSKPADLFAYMKNKKGSRNMIKNFGSVVSHITDMMR